MKYILTFTGTHITNGTTVEFRVEFPELGLARRGAGEAVNMGYSNLAIHDNFGEMYAPILDSECNPR